MVGNSEFRIQNSEQITLQFLHLILNSEEMEFSLGAGNQKNPNSEFWILDSDFPTLSKTRVLKVSLVSGFEELLWYNQAQCCWKHSYHHQANQSVVVQSSKLSYA